MHHLRPGRRRSGGERRRLLPRWPCYSAGVLHAARYTGGRGQKRTADDLIKVKKNKAERLRSVLERGENEDKRATQVSVIICASKRTFIFILIALNAPQFPFKFKKEKECTSGPSFGHYLIIAYSLLFALHTLTCLICIPADPLKYLPL